MGHDGHGSRTRGASTRIATTRGQKALGLRDELGDAAFTQRQVNAERALLAHDEDLGYITCDLYPVARAPGPVQAVVIRRTWCRLETGEYAFTVGFLMGGEACLYLDLGPVSGTQWGDNAI